jgi:4-aminobutyrate aminotransferase-like enzyme
MSSSERNAEMLERYNAHVAANSERTLDIVVQRAHGSYLWDVDGERYLDFTSGNAVNNVGHCHPVVVTAVRRQIEQLIHTSTLACHATEIELAEKLASIAPNGLDGVFLCGSADEAMRAAHQICGTVNVADQRESAFGRTGNWFEVPGEFAVPPDVVVFGSSMASGLPIGGFLARKDALDGWARMQRGGTCGANPVACAAALATIRVIESENLLENARKMGERILARIEEAKASFRCIGEVRGAGLLISFDVVDADGEPDRERAMQLVAACFNEKLLLLRAGAHDHEIRFLPPLNCSQNEVDDALDILEVSLSRI